MYVEMPYLYFLADSVVYYWALTPSHQNPPPIGNQRSRWAVPDLCQCPITVETDTHSNQNRQYTHTHTLTHKTTCAKEAIEQRIERSIYRRDQPLEPLKVHCPQLKW